MYIWPSNMVKASGYAQKWLVCEVGEDRTKQILLRNDEYVDILLE